MRKFISFFVLVCAVFAPLVAFAAKPEPTEIIIKFVKNKKKSDVTELSGATDAGEIPQLGVKIMKVKNPKAIAKLIQHNKHIEYAEVNEELEFFATPNDPNWRSQSSLLSAINAPAGWDITTGANGPLIAVIDSGVIATHPDLPTLRPGYAPAGDVLPNSDTAGHGTAVAGTIGMVGNNKTGGVGINWNANILPIKIDDANGKLSTTNGARGIIWAADNGAKIINCSWGGPIETRTLRDAVNYAYNKGVAIFAATGNAGVDTVSYPARYENVMAVGGTNDGKTRASGSQFGPGIDVVAMNSYYTASNTGGYASKTGTSFAAPQVTGLAALILTLRPDTTPAKLYEYIRTGAKPLGGGYNTQTGYGLIDVGRTLSLVAADKPVKKMCECSCQTGQPLRPLRELDL